MASRRLPRAFQRRAAARKARHDDSSAPQANGPAPSLGSRGLAVARGVQVAGTLLCVMDNRDLKKCECFIDLAMTETKEQVKRMLVAAMYDWTGLARFSRRAAGSV